MTITCTLESEDSDCANYIQAITVDKGKRDTALRALQLSALGLIFGGGLVALIADIVEFFGKDEGIASKLTSGLDLVVDGANLLSSIATAFPQVAPFIYRIIGAFNAVAGVVKSALALLRSLGALAQYALDYGWIVAEGLLKGLPGVLGFIASKLVGDTILEAAAGAGHAMAAWGYKLLADYQSQENMDIGAWCKQNPSASCMEIPSNTVTVSLY